MILLAFLSINNICHPETDPYLKKIGRRILKILAWTAGSIIALLLLVIILIQVPAVQDFLRGKVVAYLENKLGTRVAIGRIDLDLPGKLVLENVYFEDQKKDTLLAGERLAVNIGVFRLLKNEIAIHSLELEGIRANIYRLQPDTVFNYEYIINAFSGEQKASKPADSSKPLKFDIGKVHLSRITATYRDDQTGNDVYCSLGEFSTRIRTFDPGKMIFDIPRVYLGNVDARIRQYKPLLGPKPVAVREAESNEPLNIGLDFGTLDLENIRFAYDNSIFDLSTRLSLGRLLAEGDSIDLGRLYVRLKKLELSHTDAAVVMGATQQGKVAEEETEEIAATQANNSWHFIFDKVVLDDNRFRFDNNNMPRQVRGMDYAHLDASDLNLDAERLSFTPAVFEGDIRHLAVNERSGLRLKELRTLFRYDERQAYLQDLYLETDKTLIKDRLAIRYPSIASLTADIGSMYVDAALKDSRIAGKDILIFAPQLSATAPFNKAPDAVYRLSASLRGPLRDLAVANLELSGLDRTALKMNGSIRGLPDPDRTYYNVRIDRLSTSQRDIDRLLPPGTLPPDIRVPETMDLQGVFAGRIKEFSTSLTLRSSRGNVKATVYLKDMGASYAASIGTVGLDVGYLTRQEQDLGRVTMQAQAKGGGFDPKTAVSDFRVQVFSAELMGYDYRNLSLEGKMARGTATVAGAMRDPNLRFSLDGKAVFKNDYPAVRLDLMLDGTDLRALKLSQSALRLHSHIVADFSNTDPDRLNGQLYLTDLIAATDSIRIVTDTVVLTAVSADSGSHIRVLSDALVADLEGRYKLTELGTALQNTIHRYYSLPGYRPAPVSPQQWTLQARVVPSPLLFAFAPQLKGSDTLRASVAFNTQDSSLNLYAAARRLVFAGNTVDSLKIRAQAADTSLNYAITLDDATNAAYHVHKTSLSGSLDSNELDFDLRINDRQDRLHYGLAGDLDLLPGDAYRLSLQPGSLLLDYQAWTIPADNYLQYQPQGITAGHFELSNGSQLLSLNSRQPVPTAPLDLQFRNFSIETLTGMAGQDSLLLGGVINGDASVQNVTTNPVFTSDLTILDFSYHKDTIGNVLVKVNNQTANILAANVQVQGYGNDVQLSGDYYVPDQRMNMLLAINNINLARMTGLSAGQLQDAGGNLKGNVRIDGTVQQPALNGTLHFDNAYVVPALLGERFRLSDERIAVDPRGIGFDRFTLVDSAGNKATIDGRINTPDFRDYSFDLRIRADNFQAVNVRRKRGEQTFFGRLNLSTNMAVAGSMDAPRANGTLRINKGTDFKMLLPDDDPEVESRIGVVRFVNRSDSLSGILAVKDTLKTRSGLKGFDVSMNIETDSAARFTMIIDERNGDALSLRGVANLTGGIDPSGKTTLTGPFVMQQGSYLLTLNFLRRQFDIQPGSTITWTGDPMTALVDITAVYEVNTASLDLIEPQLAGRSQAEINRFKQKLPFQVLLKMKDELTKPTISFDIRLSEEDESEWREVATKLDQIRQDQSELNKQVFALLLLRRFVGEDPMQSSAGGGNTAERYVRESASRILTDQLNRLAGSLITGVDLNFGLTSGDDYSTGALQQRTDLNVNLSKRLLNDRLRVNVGNNFELEGPRQNNQNASQIASDVSIDYQLTKDGRYLIRGYRKNQYQDIVVGQVVENGVTFIFTIDYDHFKEFFAKPRNRDRKEKKKDNQNEATHKKQ